jgi:hypothetical protein
MEISFILIVMGIFGAIWAWGRVSYKDGYAEGYRSSNTDLEYRMREVQRKSQVIILLKLQQKGLLKQDEDGTLIGADGVRWEIPKT